MGATIDPGELSVFLASCDPAERRIVDALRQVVRACAADASEGLRFNALCFFRAGAPWGAIGGNICMIESPHARHMARHACGGRKEKPVRLSFIHGAALDDPDDLLRGSGKAKRFIEIPSVDVARSPAVRRLIRRAVLHAQSTTPRARAVGTKTLCPKCKDTLPSPSSSLSREGASEGVDEG